MKEYTTLFPFQHSDILTTAKIGNRKPNIFGDLKGFENIRSCLYRKLIARALENNSFVSDIF
jgi:hypothetical protein